MTSKLEHLGHGGVGPVSRLRLVAALAAALLWSFGAACSTNGSDASPGGGEDDAHEPGDVLADGGDAGPEAGGLDVADGGDALVPDAEPDAAPDGDAGPSPDAAGDTVVAPDVVEDTIGFPSHELMVKITSPGGGPTASLIGSRTTVGGLLFGDADTMTWQASTGASGEIEAGTFWGSGPIDLDPGDNTITVTAAQGDKTASDTIVITYNPAFKFDGPLVARPNVAWLNTSTTVVFTIPMGQYGNFDGGTVKLYKADANGGVLSTAGSMVDNGNTSSAGDEIEGDGVYSAKTSVNCGTTEPVYFRAGVQITQNATSYEALSPTIPVYCAAHLTPSECNGNKQVIDSAALQLNGGATAQEVVDTLLADPSVAEAGTSSGDGHGVWIRFQSGVLGAVMGNPAGTRGPGGASGADGQPQPAPPAPAAAAGVTPAIGENVHEVGSRSAIVLAPFASEFGSTEDGPAVATVLGATECPSFALEGEMALQGPSASLDRFRGLSSYGIVSISTHGDALFETMDPAQKRDVYHWDHMGAQEVLWSGDQVVCGNLMQTNQSCTVTSSEPNGSCPTGTVCLVTEGSGGSSSSGVCLDRTQADLRLGRLVMTNKGYAMTPAFFEAYAGSGFPKSFVNLGACRSMYNGTLASTFFAHGALAITGFSDIVDSAWAGERVKEVFDGAVGKGLVGHAFSVQQDPSHPGSFWRLLGAGNLDLSASEILNASFETGDTTGWHVDGDGRVVPQLGGSAPTQGKFMGLISTGLGYTVQTGTLEQDFCIPADKTQLEIYWKFFSEEFKEFCGSTYQDNFQAVLTGAAGQITVVDLTIDDLCGYGDGSCGSCNNPTACDLDCMGESGCQLDTASGYCTGNYPCDCGKYFMGLTASDVSFDQGGVYNVLWQKTTKNIQALAGQGKVNLRLYATDTGDSIYDTVILIDGIRFK